MSYTIDITVPLHIEADTDADARLIAEHLSRVLAQQVSYPHAAEVIDAPHISVNYSAPYEESYHVYESGTGQGPDIRDADPGDCAECREERAARKAIWNFYHA